MKIIKKIKNTMAMIAATLVLTGCSTTFPPQPDISKNVPDGLFSQEVQFPLSIKPIHHNPVPDDPIGLVEFAMFLSSDQGKHGSAAKLYLEVSKFPSSDNQLAIDGLTAACVEYIIAGDREGFINTAESLLSVIENLEFEIIRNDQTVEIINFLKYIVSDGTDISPSLSFLFTTGN